MRYKPTCVGYLRTDVSGVALLWDQGQIRKLATCLGYDFADMVIYDPKFGRPPLARLKAQVTRLDAEAVIVPSPEHFEGGEMPGSLVRQIDVIAVNPEADPGTGGPRKSGTLAAPFTLSQDEFHKRER
ncbi:hypothetical protein [Nocardia sp. NBC_00511]|uniref:hypothetical protein n=1 Tax=Nocardia sp. NBC_00511 TaxID=2903591 RepID=UPI0030E23BB6